ncbi:MAG TPA: DUF4118 domain-containing protein, partial [Gemmataceae bacterium]
MHDRSPSPVLRYGAAALAVVLATAARLWLTPGLGPEQLPFITYFPALVFAAWFGGLGPALLTVGLGSLAAAYFFIPPQGTLLISGPVGGTSLVVFLLVGAATALLSQSMRAAERRAAAHARDAAAQRERLRVTLASIGDGVLVTDAEGRVVSLNAVAEALTGWETSAARGRPLAEVFRIVNEQTRRPAEDPVAKVLSEGVVIGLG